MISLLLFIITIIFIPMISFGWRLLPQLQALALRRRGGSHRVAKLLRPGALLIRHEFGAGLAIKWQVDGKLAMKNGENVQVTGSCS